MAKSKRIVVPVIDRKSRRHRKRAPTKTNVHAALEDTPDQYARLPTLVFERRYPKTVWVVPACKVPMYWFDIYMLRKGLITSIPPNIFLAGGHRFKVIAQDHKVIGVGYTRWLVYEEAAVPKGQTP